MAIQLPEELQYLLVVVVGERWPEADEDKLREMAQVWYRLADHFEDALRAGDSPAQSILAENFGESITAFGKCWERFSVGGEGGSQGYLRDAAEMCRNFGEALEQFAGDVEATKDYILIQLGILAAEVALGVAGSVFTFGVSGAAAAAATAATRVVIQQALKQLLRQALKHAAKMAVRGAIEGVLDNALLQGLKQIHGGSPVNVQELLLSGAQGAAGGALGAGFGAGANRLGRHLPGGDGFVKDAAQEFAAEVATNAAVSYGTAALTGQHVGISDILGGTGRGVVTSGASHLGDKLGGGDKLAGMSLPTSSPGAEAGGDGATGPGDSGAGSSSRTSALADLTETTSSGGGTGISSALTTQITSGSASGGVLGDVVSADAGGSGGRPAGTSLADPVTFTAAGGDTATPPRDGSSPASSDGGPAHGATDGAPARAETATGSADAAGGRAERATADGGGSPVDSARDAGRAEAPRTDAPGNPTDSGTPTAGGRTDHGAAPGRPDAPITAHTAAVESPPREAGPAADAPAQGAPPSHDGPARPAVDTGAPHAPVGDIRGDGPAERAPAGDGRAAAADGPRADSGAQHGATGPAQPRGADTATGPDERGGGGEPRTAGPAPSHGGPIGGPTASHGGPTARGATPADSTPRTGDRPEQAELAFHSGTSTRPDSGLPPHADAAPDGTGPRTDAPPAGGVPRGVDGGMPRTRPTSSGDIPGQRGPADRGPADRGPAPRPEARSHPQTVRPDQNQYGQGGQAPRHGADVPGPQARPHSPDQAAGRRLDEPDTPYGREGVGRFRERLWDRIKRALFGPSPQEQGPHAPWQHGGDAGRAAEARAYAEHMRAVREYAHQHLQPHEQRNVHAHRPDLWRFANQDVGRLMTDADAQAQVSALTGSDVPPPADTTRPYDRPGGLRRPLLQHQQDLERLVPRNPDGTFQRAPALMIKPGVPAPWLRAVNDGGPQADPTRGQNCVDCTISLFETFTRGRPRVSAPRTFDGYAKGDVRQVLNGEADGPGRTEDVTGGRYQRLFPGVANVPPHQAVASAYDAIAQQLAQGGDGAFAFIITNWPDGGAHQWAAVNQGGKIVWVDPQLGIAQEHPPYPRVVSIDALVVSGNAVPMPIAGQPLSGYSARPPTPEYLAAQQQSSQQGSQPQVGPQYGYQQPAPQPQPGPHQQPPQPGPQQYAQQQPAPWQRASQQLPHQGPWQQQGVPHQGHPGPQPYPQQGQPYPQHGQPYPGPDAAQQVPPQPGPWYGAPVPPPHAGLVQHGQAQVLPHQGPWQQQGVPHQGHPGPQPYPQQGQPYPQQGWQPQMEPQHGYQQPHPRQGQPYPTQPGPRQQAQPGPWQHGQPAPHQAVPRSDPRQAEPPAPPRQGWSAPDAQTSAPPRPEDQASQASRSDFQALYEPPTHPAHPEPAPEPPTSEQAASEQATGREDGKPDFESFYLPVRDGELLRLLREGKGAETLFRNGLEGLLGDLSEDKRQQVLSTLTTSYREAVTLIKQRFLPAAYIVEIRAPRDSEMAQALRALAEGRLAGGEPALAAAIGGESIKSVIKLERDSDTDYPPLHELTARPSPDGEYKPDYEYQRYVRTGVQENPNFSLERATTRWAGMPDQPTPAASEVAMPAQPAGRPPASGSAPPPGSAVPPGGETPGSVAKPDNFSPALSNVFDRLPLRAQEQLVRLFEQNGGRSVGVERRLEGMARRILGQPVPLDQIPTDTLVEVLESTAAQERRAQAEAPIPLSPDRAEDLPLLEQVTELKQEYGQAARLLDTFRQQHPDIPGLRDWERRLREQSETVDDMLGDRSKATEKRINGTRGNIAGIRAEIEAALAIPRLPAEQLRELAGQKLTISEVSKKLRCGTFRSDADVVFTDENGRSIWVDTKDYPPFGDQSSRWKSIEKQVDNQIKIAEAEEAAGRKRPEVAFYFPRGVDPSVCRKLQEKGVIVLGELRSYLSGQLEGGGVE
ncbi:hypothetical protein C3Y87_09075 [Carbonactinospora thermoautotrophica]|uniref:toxin glutamine deamidase domain-containing protein n=1 Tax=Carbonactinospora thermoautotrophica TaxID=1469144 RepID=UPI0022713A62|nr:toxin glutamine deamidase domain-containing protein [Carbonactinospora thermoautotrophica]MCX9191563.1 hypothetical protein [Carbonactinospora thermoautotrophica]